MGRLSEPWWDGPSVAPCQYTSIQGRAWHSPAPLEETTWFPPEPHFAQLAPPPKGASVLALLLQEVTTLCDPRSVTAPLSASISPSSPGWGPPEPTCGPAASLMPCCASWVAVALECVLPRGRGQGWQGPATCHLEGPLLSVLKFFTRFEQGALKMMQELTVGSAPCPQHLGQPLR